MGKYRGDGNGEMRHIPQQVCYERVYLGSLVLVTASCVRYGRENTSLMVGVWG